MAQTSWELDAHPTMKCKRILLSKQLMQLLASPWLSSSNTYSTKWSVRLDFLTRWEPKYETKALKKLGQQEQTREEN